MSHRQKKSTPATRTQQTAHERAACRLDRPAPRPCVIVSLYANITRCVLSTMSGSTREVTSFQTCQGYPLEGMMEKTRHGRSGYFGEQAWRS